ncbi:hypothetical protein [Pyxidicoccus xibeiensis]|uniref:hypothetical protein n=1 Tax=Pyxidicoccus xibeiensis TaxID=2906759 RepID=UPI0020A81A97|nr:hypothetical protein [Pyxidicoccus xibeiensis]MCP3136508.1 hypothetical protein [Pyxidicoccus xibeiensis]
MSPVTLQVNLAPTDFPHARLILPHQLRQLGPSVQEILLVVDLHRSQGARFAEAWVERKPKMEQLLSELSAADPRIRVVEVDYSPATTRALSEQFFGGTRLPMKDSRGGPYHSYFFGLAAAAHRHVLHLDADMLIGGGSRTWVAEAEAQLASREDLVSCSPLSGPPRADGTVAGDPRGFAPDASVRHGFRFRRFSSRVFFMDREAFVRRVGPLRARLAPPIHVLRALRAGNPPYREPENLVTRTLARKGLGRLDFLGEAPGLWTLHPQYRSPTFYARLPELIARVESGDMPDDQRGQENVQDSLVDWSDVRAARRRWYHRK